MFGTKAAGDSTQEWSPRAGVIQAVRELNNKSDGVADGLLPRTRLYVAFRDSKCDSTAALSSALHLVQDAFDGDSVSAIIGAGCSGGSATAAQVAEGARVPIVSPSSASPSLSDGRLYPFFLRTHPSDIITAVGICDVLRNLLLYSSVALASSTDSYGAGAADAFKDAATSSGIKVITTVSFRKDTVDFAPHQRPLLQSNARIVALFCQSRDGARFLQSGLAVGLGGEGFVKSHFI